MWCRCSSWWGCIRSFCVLRLLYSEMVVYCINKCYSRSQELRLQFFILFHHCNYIYFSKDELFKCGQACKFNFRVHLHHPCKRLPANSTVISQPSWSLSRYMRWPVSIPSMRLLDAIRLAIIYNCTWNLTTNGYCSRERIACIMLLVFTSQLWLFIVDILVVTL